MEINMSKEPKFLISLKWIKCSLQTMKLAQVVLQTGSLSRCTLDECDMMSCRQIQGKVELAVRMVLWFVLCLLR